MDDKLQKAEKRVRLMRKNPPVPHDEYERDTRLLADAYLAEHREDDGELVTPDFMWEIGIGDSAFAKDSKRFELCPGVRVMFFACQGPKCWNAEVWVGDATRKILNPTRGQVRRLASALGIELKGGV